MIVVTTAQINNDHRWFCKQYLIQPKSKIELGLNQYAFKSSEIPKDFFQKFKFYYVEREKLFLAYDKEASHTNIEFPIVATNTDKQNKYVDDWSFGGKALVEVDEEGNPKNVNYIPPTFEHITDGNLPLN